MLARITYGLVGAALITLVAGFFQKSSNTLLYVSIILSVVAIAMVLVGAARRAREAPAAAGGLEPAMSKAASKTMEEEIPDELLSPFEEEELVSPFEDEEEEVEVVRARRPAAGRKTAAKAQTKVRPRAPRAAGRTSGGRSTTSGARTTTAKVVVVPGRDRYHRSTCRFIQGKADTEEVSAATAKRRGYQPCSACKPA